VAAVGSPAATQAAAGSPVAAVRRVAVAKPVAKPVARLAGRLAGKLEVNPVARPAAVPRAAFPTQDHQAAVEPRAVEPKAVARVVAAAVA
jgi:hypothetical protein